MAYLLGTYPWVTGKRSAFIYCLMNLSQPSQSVEQICGHTRPGGQRSSGTIWDVSLGSGQGQRLDHLVDTVSVLSHTPTTEKPQTREGVR
jgi:hypothetical protein